MDATHAHVPQPDAGRHFDAVFTALSFWIVCGAYLDAWAHRHLDTALETFFTPWHAVLYSGFFAAASYLGWHLFRAHAAGGRTWLESVPKHYRWAALGVALFMLGGALDAWWHLTFGVEKDVDALLSPTHLLLAVGTTLIVSGPYRAALHRPSSESPTGIRASLITVLSLTLTLSVITFMTQFTHPFVDGYVGVRPDQSVLERLESLSISSVIIQSAFMVGLVLLAVRRWKLPLGSMTILLTVNALWLSFMADRFEFVAGAFLAGVCADLLLRQLGTPIKEPVALHLFGFALPVLYHLFYFLILRETIGFWWSVHLWTGTIFIAGLVGLMVSYIVHPLKNPDEGTH